MGDEALTRRTARFCILHIVLAVAAVSGWLWGLPLWPDHGLAQIVSATILTALAWGIWQAWRAEWEGVEWLALRLPMLGLLGTVLGFIGAFHGYSAAVGGEAEAAVSAVAGGMAVSLHSTLLGIGSSLWLQIVRRAVP